MWGTLHYSCHLRLTANYTLRFAHLLPLAEKDMETVFAAAWFHDALEDARLTYNDLTKIFDRLNAECGCDIRTRDAAEMVYALTNDKGRTRAERAGERYYAGIRQTPFAPYLKMCDRLANLRHSTLFYPHQRMAEIYAREMPHFLESIGPVPEAVVRHAEDLLA
ncbi:MAG: phosphodiesterase [Alloprevotella sp.]